MNLTNSKKRIMKGLSTIGTTITLLAIKSSICFGADTTKGIGTTEVEAAAENIKRVIISIAMPLRWCFNFCKCCCCSNKNDSKC